MDIEVSLNFERALFFAHDRDGAAVAALMDELRTSGRFRVSENAMTALRRIYDSGAVDEDGTSAEITHSMETRGELLCPHSAVGVRVADRHLADHPLTPMITLATAHPAKFPDAVEAATGHRPGLPARMADLFEREERVTEVPNDLAALEALIRERRRT